MGLAILLVEDDARFADALGRHLRKEQHEVVHAATGEDGVRSFQTSPPDVVLLDLRLPGMSGLEALEQMKRLDESIPVLVMTAHGSIATAVEAMRLGAQDYVTKPIDLEALAVKLGRARDVAGLRSDLRYLLDRDRRAAGFESFVGSCPAMQVVFEKIREVARTDNTTVLVTGESGTGKELVAQAVHSLSARRGKPLMQVDCTSIPLPLLESELFGHERGAFTGADQAKKGLLELADQGTLLLDEIGDMDPVLQSKLLRVLQERQFRRVGGTRNLRFDVRVIAATNQDLDARCREGRFRRDLLYRLKVFQIELPPLRQRGGDILELADAFVAGFARAFRKPVRGLEPAARRALAAYDFPGNVRELRNVIEQAVILTKGELIGREAVALPDVEQPRAAATVTAEPPAALSLEALGPQPLRAAEQELIRQALARSGGSKKRAAALLGISRFALQRRLDRLALGGSGDEP